MKKIIFIFLVIFVVVIVNFSYAGELAKVGAKLPAEKHNDANTGGDVSGNITKAHKINYGKYYGMLTQDDDGDVYAVDYNPGDIVNVVVTPGKEMDIIFYCMVGSRAVSPQNQKGIGEPEIIKVSTDITDKDARRFSVAIKSVTGSGIYNLDIAKTAQNDADKNQDAPMDWIWPLSINTGSYENCYLGFFDYFDDYAVKLKAGQKLTIRVLPYENLDLAIGTGASITLHLVDSGGYVNNNPKGGVEEKTITADKADTYSFSIAKIDDTSGTYKLEVVVE